MARLVLRPHVTTIPTADGMILLDQRSGRYWQINLTAAFVARVLLSGATTEEATAQLAAQHPTAADRAAQDVAAFIRQMHDARLAVYQE
ncbi:lasso peptide biosynthesis PqqD family chaperone [Streptomyces parvus]|uniref:lasso peptide biosynthesis PqqD family chaperone n=1 Tax=Streptomyces parvus TaxID=66428 RepID=UPI0033D2160B